MNSIWILGAGKFGLRAGAELIQKHPHANVLLIDHDPLACRAAQSLGFITEHCDGIAYLSRMLNDSDVVDLIVPAIPAHVIFKWIQNRLLNHFQIEKVPIPASLLAILPNPIKGENHTIYTSIADFQCPGNCPEPDRECMVTGKPRPCIIYKVLQQYTGIGFQTVVIRSQILAPGVGGFRPRVMFQAFDRIKQSQKPVIISTACSCHAVVDAFQLISSSGQVWRKEFDTVTVEEVLFYLAIRALGYSNDQIEGSFIPVIALRNYIDVGHPFLSILKRKQLSTLYLFTENIEDIFRQLLRKIFNSMNTGTFYIKEYDELTPKKDVQKIIERMNCQLEAMQKKT